MLRLLALVFVLFIIVLGIIAMVVIIPRHASPEQVLGAVAIIVLMQSLRWLLVSRE